MSKLMFLIASFLIVSCSDYTPYGSYEKFQDDFKSYIGGNIDPNQTWGWGDGNQGAATTRSSAYIEGDPFTDYGNTDSYYKDDADVQKLINEGKVTIGYDASQENSYISSHHIFYLEDGDYAIHLWSGTREIYVKGNVTITEDGTNQAIIYVLPGSKLTLKAKASSHYINDLKIYISENAEISFDSYAKTDDGTKIYETKIFNRGTLSLPEKFYLNGGSIIVNEGKTVCSSSLNSSPGSGLPAIFYNYGDLYIPNDFLFESCAHFYNEGIVNVKGDTKFTSNEEWWINKGHYYTKSMYFSSQNETVYNYCQLLVEDTFSYYDGKFNLMKDSYVEAQHAVFRNFLVDMREHSGIIIHNGTQFIAQGDGTIQGFTGLEDSYIKLGGTTTVDAHKYTFTIYGKVEYAIKEIIDEGASNPGLQPTYEFAKGAKEVPYDQLNPTPNEDECFVPWTPEDHQKGGLKVRVIVEDLPAQDASHQTSKSDWDFNDAVFDVEIKDDDLQYIYITLHACGGTLPLCIYDDDHEVHSLFGFSTTDVVFINADTDKKIIDTNRTPVTFQLPRAYNSQGDLITTRDDINKYIPVYVKGRDGDIKLLTAYKGEAPAKICVGTDYIWCDESVDIESVYSGFKKWAEEGGLWDNNVWYRGKELKASNLKVKSNPVEVIVGGEIDLSQYISTSSNGSITYSISGGASLGTLSGSTFKANSTIGEVTITITQAETDDYEGKTVTLTVKVVGKKDPKLAVKQATVEVTVGNTVDLSAYVTSLSNGEKTYTSSDSSKGSLNGNSSTFTANAIGEVTVTIKQEETDTYNSATVTLTVKIVEKKAQSGEWIEIPMSKKVSNFELYRIQDVIDAADGCSQIMIKIEGNGWGANMNFLSFNESSNNYENNGTHLTFQGTGNNISATGVVDMDRFISWIANNYVYFVAQNHIDKLYVKPVY